MTPPDNLRFATRLLHHPRTGPDHQGATQPPVYQTAAHATDTAQQLSDRFAGRDDGHIYMRLSNPTNTALQDKITDLEAGAGALVTGSGMAAIANACLALLRAGDELVAAQSLFMSTGVLFTDIFPKYGITARLVDPCEPAAVEQAITDRTRFIYLETIGNPRLDVPDIRLLAELAHRHDLPLLVDNTLATPYLCRPLTLGADIVLHSTTKYLNGHGSATGGAIIDGGRFWWQSDKFADFHPYLEKNGATAFLAKTWKEHHINFGTTQAPWHSYLTLLGLDTLAVRMDRHLSNALAVAQFLQEQPVVRQVNYPGFKDHFCHDIACRQFQRQGFGALITFTLADQAACFHFINHLQLICHLANLGDCKTLVIHPASTQYQAFDPDTRNKLGIGDNMLRLSVGIEDAGDICRDIGQALDKIVP